jgi:hypothetical protein
VERVSLRYALVITGLGGESLPIFFRFRVPGGQRSQYKINLVAILIFITCPLHRPDCKIPIYGRRSNVEIAVGQFGRANTLDAKYSVVIIMFAA